MSQFDDIQREISARIDKINRSATIAVSNVITNRTHVSSSMLKGSWQFAIGSKPTEQIDGIGRDSMGVLRSEISGFDIGQTAWFLNLQPYSLKMEYYSKAGPVGMVRPAVANWQKYVDNAARAIR